MSTTTTTINQNPIRDTKEFLCNSLFRRSRSLSIRSCRHSRPYRWFVLISVSTRFRALTTACSESFHRIFNFIIKPAITVEGPALKCVDLMDFATQQVMFNSSNSTPSECRNKCAHLIARFTPNKDTFPFFHVGENEFAEPVFTVQPSQPKKKAKI
jgi:hypothetical protein